MKLTKKNRSKNQINLGNDILYNLFDYGIEYIKKITTKKQRVCNSLSVIYSSIKENYILRQGLDVSENGKRLNILKTSRRNNYTLIISAIESINDREVEIYDLTRKRDLYSNDVNRIRQHKNHLKLILK